MIKNLRKRFIFAAMTSTFGVLFVIMSILNIANYSRIVSRADETLSELADNNGEFDSRNFMNRKFKAGADGQITDDGGADDPVADIQGSTDNSVDRSGNSQPPEKPDGKKSEMFSPETPFQTRYFSVVIADGAVESYSLDNIAAIDEEDAETYALQIIDEGSGSGFIDIYRYRVTDCDDGTRIIFVDCRQEIESFRNTLVYSVGVSLLGFLAVFLLVLFWSKKIFKPVAESYEKQKRFITDASHEIKTPLTIIDANTEVIEMVNGESEWTQNTRDQVKRLTALTNQMVALSRLDENPEPRENAEFDLSDVAYEVIDHFSSLSEVRGKKISADIEDGIKYTGDENSIRQLISILVDNAMKYAVESADIDISLKRDGRKVKLVLRNLTEGMSEGTQDILFERFYRPDSSRNSETGGSGIGLSLARSIVESHKGKISARCDKEGYITFQVIL